MNFIPFLFIVFLMSTPARAARPDCSLAITKHINEAIVHNLSVKYFYSDLTDCRSKKLSHRLKKLMNENKLEDSYGLLAESIAELDLAPIPSSKRRGFNMSECSTYSI